MLQASSRCLRKFHQPYIGVAILLTVSFDKYSEKSEKKHPSIVVTGKFALKALIAACSKSTEICEGLRSILGS